MDQAGRRVKPDQEYFGTLSDEAADPLLDGFLAPRPPWRERMEAGRHLRQSVPRSSHATYVPPTNRPDPVAVLEAQNAVRVKKLIPVRNARMSASPFAFLRGAAAIMAADLVPTPVTGLHVAACGDMHVANFGLFASAERNLVFGINDFDEVHPGPWEWDLKRLVASIALATVFMGGKRSGSAEAIHAAVRAYREQMRRYASMGHLEVWYDRIDEAAILAGAPARLQRRAQAMMAKARAKGHQRNLERMVEDVEGERRIIEDVPLIVRETHLDNGMPIHEALEKMLRGYVASLTYERRHLLSRYQLLDVARKTVGVGSVGTGCWVLFLQGIDAGDPLFLQVKEARESVLAPHVRTRLRITNQGRRVVAGQRLTQGSPDIFLGWGEGEGKHFFVRQLADMKGGARFEEGATEKLDGFAEYSALCGKALALAHAKSGDAAAIAGYCGKSDALDEALASFAMAYLDQTEADHAAMTAAIRSGRLIAQEIGG